MHRVQETYRSGALTALQCCAFVYGRYGSLEDLVLGSRSPVPDLNVHQAGTPIASHVDLQDLVGRPLARPPGGCRRQPIGWSMWSPGGQGVIAALMASTFLA